MIKAGDLEQQRYFINLSVEPTPFSWPTVIFSFTVGLLRQTAANRIGYSIVWHSR